jgi:hypothetical protein
MEFFAGNNFAVCQVVRAEGEKGRQGDKERGGMRFAKVKGRIGRVAGEVWVRGGRGLICVCARRGGRV